MSRTHLITRTDTLINTESTQHQMASAVERAILNGTQPDNPIKRQFNFDLIGTVKGIVVVKDWDEFYKYIAKNKFWHLLQKRTSDAAVREIFEQGKKIDGVMPFTKRRVNLRVAAVKA